MSKNLYDEDSIQKLDPLSFTRLRPDTYLGSNEDSTQLVREIISNCSDEFLAGNCDEIHIDYDSKNNVVTVTDNGQGILPNVEKENGKTILEMVYGEVNVSGKYERTDDAVYKISTGAFGIGAALSNYLSHWLIATTKRNGQFETVYFKEGKFEKRESGTCPKNEHGVTVLLNPSEEFFRNEKPNIKKLKQEMFDLACVCAGLKIIFDGEEIYHPDGISDILQKHQGEEFSLISNPFSFKEKNDKQMLDFCLTVTSKSSVDIVPFCNYGLIESGTPVTAIKSCLTRVLNKWGKEEKIIKDNLTGNSLQEGMIIVFNLASADIRYDSQTKVRVTSTEDNSFISSTLGEQFELYLDNNPEDGKAIIEKALISKKAAEAAKKARERVKNKTSNSGNKKKKKFMDMPTTLIDANGKDRSKCELIVVEGLSPASSLVAQRDAMITAVYSVRGMMLNLQKSSKDKIMQNKEINNLITALGLDYNPKTGEMDYDINKLRYGKIIAASDADPAGNAIENLLFNILWFLCPELIINGHVYSAEPPLFKVTTKNNKYVFLADQQALNDYLKDHERDVKTVHRAKGLAEETPEELASFILDPDTRQLKQLVVEDFEKTDDLFKDLYGKDVPPRVEYINNNIWGVEVDYE